MDNTNNIKLIPGELYKLKRTIQFINLSKISGQLCENLLKDEIVLYLDEIEYPDVDEYFHIKVLYKNIIYVKLFDRQTMDYYINQYFSPILV